MTCSSYPSSTQKLIEMKDGLSPLITAVVHPTDVYSLKGAVEAAKEGLIIPILVGPKAKIEDVATKENIDISPFEIVATRHSHAAAERAVLLARTGHVEALMKGKLHTDELMAAVVQKEGGLRTGRRMTHIFILDMPSYSKPLLLSDAVLNINPTLGHKVDIVQHSINLFRILYHHAPKVAILSAIEMVTETIPSTLDATALCKMAERGQINGGILDGPLAFDNAVSMESARIKGITSPVAGDADILIVPDLESGNMLYKQNRFLTGHDGAGIVMGAQVPIILTSRTADIDSRKASCALALCYSRSAHITI
jgi:phosphate acetyltransferase